MKNTGKLILVFFLLCFNFQNNTYTIEEPPGEPNAIENQLITAVRNGDIQEVTQILNKASLFIQLRNPQAQKALDLAQSNKHKNIVSALIQNKNGSCLVNC